MRGSPLQPSQPPQINGYRPAAPSAPPQSPPAAAGTAAAPGAMGPPPVPQVTVDYEAAEQIRRRVADRIARRPAENREIEEQRGLAWINEEVARWSDEEAAHRGVSPTPADEAALTKAVFDLQFRAGKLQPYLDDPRIEDIHLNGPDAVWLDYGLGQMVPAPPVASSEEELLDMLRRLARSSEQSERSLSTNDPFLALRLNDGSRMQVISEVSDKTYVTIRRHGVKTATLETMVGFGAIDTTLQQFLAACIQAEKNVMIAGTQKAGKTSLMRAMLRELPAQERFATVESEYELLLHELGHHTQVVAMEAREANHEGAGEITLLELMHHAMRMSLSRIVVGEVRGPEIVAMMRAMTNGKGGNLCTLHARSPAVIFDRVAELYLMAEANFSETLAYRQAANALDFIVFVEMLDERPIGGRLHRFVSHVLEVTGIGEDGRPATNQIFAPRPEAGEPRAVPHMNPACLTDLRRAGFPLELLRNPHGAWMNELPLKIKDSQGVGA